MNPYEYLIVVCAYNEENNILRCLKSIEDSIVSSSCPELFHAVCVNNSSEDETGKIAKKFIEQHNLFSYLKIEHCYLSVSRNSYKFFPNAKYIVYVDADGYVENKWAEEFHKAVIESKADIISGPVFEANTAKNNRYWELFYDYSLYSGSSYLIGANMAFKRKLLDKVDGFPTFFKSRGDESSLLLKIGLLKINTLHYFSEDLITYNNFCYEGVGFLKSQFGDGKSSNIISILRGKKYNHYLNCANRTLNVAMLFMGVVLIFTKPMIGISLILASYATNVARFPSFYSSLVKKMFNSFRSIGAGLVVIISKYFFETGFVFQMFSKKRLAENVIYETQTPNILERLNVR